MKYKKLATEVVDAVGGVGNVDAVVHCMTRLRFTLKDDAKVDDAKVKSIEGVLEALNSGAQYQVVIGTHVEDVYADLLELYPRLAGDEPDFDLGGAPAQVKGPVGRFLQMVMEIFQPVMGLLIASGMIKALLTMTVLFNWLDSASGTYTLLSAVGDALFYFFPVILGWSAAKHFGLKESMGITLGAILVYPTIVALTAGEPIYTIFQGTIFEQAIYTDFLGIPVVMQSYSTTVIPILVIVWATSKLDRWLRKVISPLLRGLFVPLITLLVAAPVALIVLGPIAMVLQDLLGQAVVGLINLNPGIAGLILGALWSILVVFGLHWGVIPLFAINIAEYGYDIINPLIFAGALASLGAVIGVIIRTKSVEDKAIAIPAAFSTFFGVNEPSLYGVLIPRSKLLWATFASAGVGGAFAGFGGAKLWNFTASGPLGLPGFINPDGIDAPFIWMVVGAVVAFALALTSALILGPAKDADGGASLKEALETRKKAVSKA